MFTVLATNVNDAFYYGIKALVEQGERQDSRAGKVLVMAQPVVTVYRRPFERVLFHPQRDANPFFHLFESLWMLAGQNDATWLDQFVGDFSSRFAEPGGTQHGAYGFRWRKHFALDGDSEPLDQLTKVVELLKANPLDRRAVIQMWDPMADLGADKRDVPCNTTLLPRIRKERGSDVLDITVFCRSNDAIWGAYGANAVHFSMLQEWLAGMIGVKIGTYYQISNNFHLYTDFLDKRFNGTYPVPYTSPYEEGVGTMPLMTNPSGFEEDLHEFFRMTESSIGTGFYRNPFFNYIAEPLYVAHRRYKEKRYDAALDGVRTMPYLDWRLAAEQWITRHSTKKGDRYAQQ